MNTLRLTLAVFLSAVLLTGTASLAQEEHAAPVPTIGASLLTRLQSPEPVTIIVTLKNQPIFSVAQQVQQRYWAELRANEEDIRAINLKYATDIRPSSQEDATQMARQQAQSVTSADQKRMREINLRSQKLKEKMRKEGMELATQAVEPEHQAIEALVNSLGGYVIYRYQITNALAVRIPGLAIRQIAAHPLVESVQQSEKYEALLDVSTPATGAGTFWAAGEIGGVFWNATCDTGVDTSHPALSTKPWTSGVFHDAGKLESDYDDVFTSTDDFQGHGTHVAGIANSTNTTYRGVAYGSSRSVNLKAGWKATSGGYMVDADGMAAVHWGLTNTSIDSINLSFGGVNATDNHAYVLFWDAVVDAKNTIAVMSAGNRGPAIKSLSSPGVSYNGLCVANVDDQGTLTRSDDIIANSSSRGPTTSGRKKPDISAPGSNIMAPAHDWEGSNPDFVEKTGTSMAAPHVSAATLLLQDVGIYDPRAIKAVLINTADFIQGATGWSDAYGWGYLNLDKAYLRRTNWFLSSVNPRGDWQSYRFYRVSAPQVGDKATLVWNRHVNYNNANYPTTYYSLNDLNLACHTLFTNQVLAESSSTIDNVEQVVVNTTSQVILTVYANTDSFSHPSTSETFALATPPGAVAATGPVLNPQAEFGTYTPVKGQNFQVRVRLQNSGDLTAHQCSLLISLPGGVTLVSGSLTPNVGSIGGGAASNYLTLTLKAADYGTQTVTVIASSDSYGVTIKGTGSFTVEPLDETPPYTVMPVGGSSHLTTATSYITNGGFESSLAGWSPTGSVTMETGQAYEGNNSVRLGPGSASLTQTVTIPGSASSSTLIFRYKSSVPTQLAAAGCRILSSSGEILVLPFAASTGTLSNWTLYTVDVNRFKGQTIQVQFYTSSFGQVGSGLSLDEVSLRASTLYVNSSSLLSLRSRDDVAVSYSEYKTGSGDWNLYSSPFTVGNQPEGPVSISYRSTDSAGNTEPAVETTVYLDKSAPKTVLWVGSVYPYSQVSGGTQKTANPGFESGLTGWTTTGSVGVETGVVHSGTRSARVGGSSAVGSIYQDIPISATAERALVSVWVNKDGGFTANAGVKVIDPQTGRQCFGLTFGGSLEPEWENYVLDVSRFRGESVRLLFEMTGSVPVAMYVDDVRVLENATVYISPVTNLSLWSAERSGVARYEYDIDSSGWQEGKHFNITGSGVRSLAYRGIDWLGHQESSVSTQFILDDQGPAGSILINSGALVTSSPNVLLTLNASDPMGVLEMRIRSDNDVWGQWQPYQPSRAYTFASSAVGVKTLQVEYRDNLGNVSPAYSDSIYLGPTNTRSIGSVRYMDLSGVSRLNGKVVTAIFPDQQWFYVSEPDRSAGIRIRSQTLPPSVGTVVDIVGHTGTWMGEREIAALLFNSVGTSTPLKPLGLNARSLGGSAFGSQPGIPGTTGLNNIGSLVRVWGRVTSSSQWGLYLEDGSQQMDTPPNPGILVATHVAGISQVRTGQYLQVTGISGAGELDGSVIRVLRPRGPEDIKVLQFEAAFVYSTQSADAQSFKSLLEGQGIKVTLVPYDKILAANWSRYHAVLIGTDTGLWDDPARVNAILGSGLPVIGIGNGGGRFMDAVTSPDLFIGWGNSAYLSASNGLVFGGDIYSYPHTVNSTPGANLRIYGSPVSTLALFDPTGNSLRLLRSPDSPAYFPVVSEAGKFYMWGYTGSPQGMGTTGKNLFSNLVFRAVKVQGLAP